MIALNTAASHDSTALIFMLVIIAVAVIPALFLSVMYRKKMSAALELLQPAFNGRVKSSFFSTSFVGEYHGYPFTITPVPAGKNTPPFLNVNLESRFSFNLQAMARSAMNDFVRKLSFRKEMSTGDREFDGRLMVISPNQISASGFLLSSEVRRAILTLFDAGYITFRISERGLFIQKPNFSLEADLTASRMEEVLKNMALLAVN